MATRSPSSQVLPDYIVHCVELLGSLGPVRVRRMFGGHGLYVDEVFLALGFGDQLFLKADDLTMARYEAAGCHPFAYEGAGRTVTTSYWSAPDEAMESPAVMRDWARLALEAALRARAAPKRAKPRPSSASPAVAGTASAMPAAKKAAKAPAKAGQKAAPGGKSTARETVAGVAAPASRRPRSR